MREFVVRPFTASDSAGASGLLVGAGWSGPALPPQFVLADADRFGAAFIATGEGEQEPVGFVRILSDRASVSYVAELVTAAGWRGRGVARALVHACIDQFPSARLDLLSTETATGFYEAVGFTTKPGYRKWP